MAYTQISYHIVYGTHNRSKCLEKENREELYKYITGILKRNKCHLYRIGGVEDHIHILTSLHPTVSLSDLIQSLKQVQTNGLSIISYLGDLNHGKSNILLLRAAIGNWMLSLNTLRIRKNIIKRKPSWRNTLVYWRNME